MLALVYMLELSGRFMYTTLSRFYEQTLQEIPHTELTLAFSGQLMTRGLIAMLLTIAPLMATAYLVALIAQYAQVGWLLSFKILAPKLDKLNPVQGFKRIFSLKAIVELIKGIAKILLVGFFVYGTIKDNIPGIMMSITQSPVGSFALVGSLIIEITKKVAWVMVVVAIADYLYQRYDHKKKMKMSIKEVKDEYKQTEGDPLIKSRQRQKQRQIAMGQATQAVPDATAVVTNPTHYAIALLYEEGMEVDAPLVVAKGKGDIALYIRRLAEEHEVPLFEEPDLARALYDRAEVDTPIPEEFFMAVAKIIAKVYAMKAKRTYSKVK